MVPASSSALMALPDRPVHEKPEAKTADGSDGQFAGLMAHLAQPPATPRAPDPPPNRTAKAERATRSEAREEPRETAPSTVMAQTESKPKVDTPTAKADATDAPAEAAANKPDTTATKTAATQPKAAAETPEVKAQVEQAVAAALPKGAALAAAMAIQAAASARPEAAGNMKTAGSDAALQALVPAGSDLPNQSMEAATAALAAKSLAPDQPKVVVQITEQAPESLPAPSAKPQAAPQADAERSPTNVAIQAALAESKPVSKETSRTDTQVAALERLKGDSTHTAEKAAKPAESPFLVKGAEHAPTKINPQSLPTVASHEMPVGSSQTMGPSTQSREGLQPSIDQLLPETMLVAPTPLLQSSDGSALAALNSLGKPAVTAPSATAPATPPAPPTPPTPPVAQVEGGVRWMLKTGSQEARLQLHPDSLGQVTIHLKVEGGEVHARLWVTEPASVQAVQEGRPHLEHSLKEQGLQLGSFDLQQGHRPFQEAPSPHTFRGSAVSEATLARQEAPITLMPSILNPHHVELYA